ncbi:GntR family transcriptional regulator [Acrocarpospora sp. B8E8]|uniref:GntR family transcriptional regulator n=1 Tax=Acrocarpospora sp. B8E8 TaxID=3153572 RepID=UPI00325E8D91
MTAGRARRGSRRMGGPGWAVLDIRRREIVEDLAGRIADGELAEGARMASVQKLRETYDIPGSIARRVQRELADRGFIRRVPGLGYVVGVPGTAPVPPHADDPDAISTFVAGPRAGRPILSEDLLLARHRAGKDAAADYRRRFFPRALTGPDAIDRYCDETIFKQVAEVMAGRIAAGEFLPGERFASLAMLRREFAISDATARRVLRELTDRGLIHTVPGRACYTGPAEAGHPSPLYQRIAAELAGQIFSGEIRINHPIPVREDLRARHGVCDHTLGEAVELLESLGWVICVPYRRPVAAPPTCWPVSLDGTAVP